MLNYGTSDLTSWLRENSHKHSALAKMTETYFWEKVFVTVIGSRNILYFSFGFSKFLISPFTFLEQS